MARHVFVLWLGLAAVLTAVTVADAGNLVPCCRCVCGNQVLCERIVADQAACDAVCVGQAPGCPGPIDPFFDPQPQCEQGFICRDPEAAPAGAPALGWLGLAGALVAIGVIGRRAVRRR